VLFKKLNEQKHKLCFTILFRCAGLCADYVVSRQAMSTAADMVLVGARKKCIPQAVQCTQ